MDQIQNWANNQERKSKIIQVTDKVTVEFGPTDEYASFTLVVTNHGDRNIAIDKVESDSKMITLQNDKIAGLRIKSGGEFDLVFDVKRTANRIRTTAKVYIDFYCCVIARSIQIIYKPNVYVRKNANAIRQNYYDAPKELIGIIGSKIPDDKRMDLLNEWIPPTKQLNFDNYANYFHGLLFLEELGMLKRLKIYTRCDIYFKKVNDKYQMELEDLFETRPSLKVGKSLSTNSYFSQLIVVWF